MIHMLIFHDIPDPFNSRLFFLGGLPLEAFNMLLT